MGAPNTQSEQCPNDGINFLTPNALASLLKVKSKPNMPIGGRDAQICILTSSALGSHTREDSSMPVFWKLSMGTGSAGEDFKHVLEVLDWIRQGVVLVHKNTKAKGTSRTTQGEDFVKTAQIGDYFYLCHGNEEPSVILFGQFTGPPNLFSARRAGWAERSFRWIKTSILPKPFSGEPKWWAPNHNSTFVSVPENELAMFESSILGPYFGIALADFRIEL